MKLIDSNQGLFLKHDGKLYVWKNGEFCEVQIKDCNGGIIAQIGGSDDDPKDGSG